MSILNYLIDSDLLQRRDIERQKHESGALGSQLDATSDDIESLRRRVTELSETVRVLLQVLAEKGTLDQEDFKDRLKALTRPHAQPCVRCGKAKSDSEMMKVGADWWCRACARNP